MARYRRSIPDPAGRTNRRGYVRRVRRPAGTAVRAQIAAKAHREKPRIQLNERLAVEADPLARISLAVGYIRSAAKKYQARPDLLERAERTLIRIGDQMFAGKRLSPQQIANNRNNRTRR